MIDRVHDSETESKSLPGLGFRERKKIEKELRYILTKKTLLDLVTGIREMFKEATTVMFYHVFKKAGKKEAANLLRYIEKREGKKIGGRSAEELVDKVLNQLRVEGYYQDYELRLDHMNKKILLETKRSVIFRLREILNEMKLELSDDELLAIGRGLVAGVFSVLTNSDVDVERAVLNEEKEEVTYILPEETYEKFV